MADSDLEIRRMAAREHRWPERELQLVPIPILELPPCRFYSVSPRELPVPGAATYALLPGGVVVSQSDRDALSKILGACDALAASAAVWAELLARFHWEVGPGKVLYHGEAPLGVGDPPRPAVTPPQLSRSAQPVLRFFLKNTETQKLYEISAVLGARGVSQLSKKRVE